MSKEIGRIGQLRYGLQGLGSMFMEEFLPELQGNRGVQVYKEMSENDSTIGAVLFAINMLMRQCELHIEPAGKKRKDKEAAEFVESCMNDMERTWADTLSEILSFMPYGWSYHEIVYKRRVGKTSSPLTNSKHTDGLIGWRKLPIRAQDTLEGWDYKAGTDDLIGMIQCAAPDYNRVTIPIDKALHFRTRSYKDNPEGQSILRTAYRDWYFKKRLQEIEAYGIERDLAGFPVLYSPADMDIWNTDDPEIVDALARAEYIVSSIRRDSREGLVLPGGYEQGTGWKLELLTSSGRRQFDTNAIIERYNKAISTSVLADFVMLGQNQVGSFALADTKTKVFSLAIGTYLDVICEVFNNQAIPRLIDVNGDHFKGITDYPKMVHGDIDEKDLQQFATFVKEMIASGALTPDEDLEAEIRRVGNLPEKKETAPPEGKQPGEDGPEGGVDELESKSMYKVMSLLEKYQNGKITREAAAQLFEGMGLDPQKIDFYLAEAEKSKAEREKKDAQKLTASRQGARKPKKVETPEEDKKDAQEAEEAKKSLGRTE